MSTWTIGDHLFSNGNTDWYPLARDFSIVPSGCFSAYSVLSPFTEPLAVAVALLTIEPLESTLAMAWRVG